MAPVHGDARTQRLVQATATVVKKLGSFQAVTEGAVAQSVPIYARDLNPLDREIVRRAASAILAELVDFYPSETYLH